MGLKTNNLENKKVKNKKEFSPLELDLNSKIGKQGNKIKPLRSKTLMGFTLIELLVVVAIIALLSSIALIALASARLKSRNAKRLSDMVQMNNALELYFATFKGYPSGTVGVPASGTPRGTCRSAR